MWLVLTGGLLGLASGVRHAMEPDHLAAVSTLVAEQRSVRASVSFAAMWGLGHASMLLAVGGLLVLLGCEMPPAFATVAELAVAAMLVFLGVRALLRARNRTHEHASHHVHHHAQSGTLRRPLAVGIVHGLAGSGALTAIVLAAGHKPMAGLVFMTLYGAGAMIGMSALAGVLRLPLARIASTARGTSTLLAISGVASVVIGVAWAGAVLL
jgi:sterol desaturase/sphingolipid hydroxylase (fatty acid hydroxylase superfamily)